MLPSRSNLAGAILVCVLAATALLLTSVLHRIWIPQAIPTYPQRIALADEKIDPNTASLASLCRLRGIGPARAQAIIDHRQDDRFESARDLARVHGIGAVIVSRNTGLIEIR